MPRKAAGERALRISQTNRIRRISRIAAASTFAAATLALAAGCSGGSGGAPVACCAYSGGTTPAASSGASASPAASPSPNGELTEPPATATAADTGDDTDTAAPLFTFSYSPSYPTIDPSFLMPTFDLPNDTPYGDGTCFYGPKLTSTTPITVNNMDEVDCSASDADYKVVKTILDSTDLNGCNNVTDAQYAFSESDTDGYGVTLWSAVYCLEGLGSFAA